MWNCEKECKIIYWMIKCILKSGSKKQELSNHDTMSYVHYMTSICVFCPIVTCPMFSRLKILYAFCLNAISSISFQNKNVKGKSCMTTFSELECIYVYILKDTTFHYCIDMIAFKTLQWTIDPATKKRNTLAYNELIFDWDGLSTACAHDLVYDHLCT